MCSEPHAYVCHDSTSTSEHAGLTHKWEHFPSCYARQHRIKKEERAHWKRVKLISIHLEVLYFERFDNDLKVTVNS